MLISRLIPTDSTTVVDSSSRVSRSSEARLAGSSGCSLSTFDHLLYFCRWIRRTSPGVPTARRIPARWRIPPATRRLLCEHVAAQKRVLYTDKRFLSSTSNSHHHHSRHTRAVSPATTDSKLNLSPYMCSNHSRTRREAWARVQDAAHVWLVLAHAAVRKSCAWTACSDFRQMDSFHSIHSPDVSHGHSSLVRFSRPEYESSCFASSYEARQHAHQETTSYYRPIFRAAVVHIMISNR